MSLAFERFFTPKELQVCKNLGRYICLVTDKSSLIDETLYDLVTSSSEAAE